MAEELPEFTAQDLKSYDGQEGRPAYIAYEGSVYDVSESKMWRKGGHMKRHFAGQDLTGEMGDAPHEEEVLERFPKVGVYKREEVAEEAEESHLPGFLDRFFRRHPFFERHPHPMTVHFPLAFTIFGPLFAVLYLITGVEGFETASFYLIGAGALMSLVAISTGFFTWWVNYMTRPMKPVIIKIVLSALLFVAAAGAFVWRLLEPSVLHELTGINIAYLVILLLMPVLVSVVGWYGATLTFPLPSKKSGKKRQ